MDYRQVLAIVIPFVAFPAGMAMIYFGYLWRHNWMLAFNFILLGLLDIYQGVVYILYLLDVVHGATGTSTFLRPANLLAIMLPMMIALQMFKREMK